MLKKILLGSVIVLGIGALVFGRSGVSYIKTGYHSIRETIKEQIPLEVEIKRARDMVDGLKPEIANNLKVIAREEVEVAKLQREVSSKKDSLAKSKQAILQLKDDVQSGAKFVTYKGRAYDMDQVRKDLSDRFKHFQTQEATSIKLEKMLEARESNLQAARRKLDEMLAAKRQIEVEVENLHSRLTMVQVAETKNQFAINDSPLSNVRQTLTEIATRIEVAEKLADSFNSTGGIPVQEDDTAADLIDQISDYFGRGNAEVETLVKNDL